MYFTVRSSLFITPDVGGAPRAHRTALYRQGVNFAGGGGKLRSIVASLSVGAGWNYCGSAAHITGLGFFSGVLGEDTSGPPNLLLLSMPRFAMEVVIQG